MGMAIRITRIITGILIMDIPTGGTVIIIHLDASGRITVEFMVIRIIAISTEITFMAPIPHRIAAL
jgi:hypothetical protein